MLPGYDACPECVGTGLPANPEFDTDEPCPTCSGVGSVPGDAAVEAAAAGIEGVCDMECRWPKHRIDTARAALVAYARQVKEN